MKKEDVLAGEVGGWVLKCDAENVFAINDPASGLWDPKANRPRDDEGDWSLADNYRAAVVQPGDRCFFWGSSEVPGWPGGLWATCDVLGPAVRGQGGGPAWIDRQMMNEPLPYLPVRWHFLPRPVPKSVVRADAVLSRSELIMSPRMSNPVALTPEEVQAMDHLIASNPPSVVSSTGRGGGPVKPTAW